MCECVRPDEELTERFVKVRRKNETNLPPWPPTFYGLVPEGEVEPVDDLGGEVDWVLGVDKVDEWLPDEHVLREAQDVSDGRGHLQHQPVLHADGHGEPSLHGADRRNS